jgi:hypothetical protein
MAAGNNPLAALAAMSAMRGMAGGGGPEGALSPDRAAVTGQLVRQQLAEYGPADPGMLASKLDSMVQEVAGMIPLTASRLPSLPPQLSAALKALQKAAEEAKKAAQIVSQVSQPIAMTAASPQGQGGPF